ncbi:hypothetical protein HYE68_001166 [Fusarium pseudograminearum]|nr:hypothetical protein HYE68_001166 [Fusarium pseudograminearum]
MKITSFLTTIIAAHYASAEMVYLVNSVKGNEISSGMAYYADGHSAANLAQPDTYTDVTHGYNVHWEGNDVKGTFSSGVTFTSKIAADAASKTYNSWVGSGNNGYKDFTCWKTSNPGSSPSFSLLYRVDGWDVYSIYFCRNNN